MLLLQMFKLAFRRRSLLIYSLWLVHFLSMFCACLCVPHRPSTVIDVELTPLRIFLVVRPAVPSLNFLPVSLSRLCLRVNVASKDAISGCRYVIHAVVAH